MSLAAWLSTREPAPPDRLLARLTELMHPDGANQDVRAEAMVTAAGEVLRRLLREGQTARDSALELLAADALATYAFEAQSDEPEAMDARCTWAMSYLAKIADSV